MLKLKYFLFCLFFIFSLMPIIGNTKTLSCPFTDSFSLQGPLNTHIFVSSVQGNLKMTQTDSTFFSLSCGGDNYRAGDLFITIGVNEWHYCNLTIHDGPLVLNPSVSFAACQGQLKYDGMDHVRGSYNYTLKFTF